MHFFGIHGDTDSALAKYLNERNDLQAGRIPRVRPDSMAPDDPHGLSANLAPSWSVGPLKIVQPTAPARAVCQNPIAPTRGLAADLGRLSLDKSASCFGEIGDHRSPSVRCSNQGFWHAALAGAAGWSVKRQLAPSSRARRRGLRSHSPTGLFQDWHMAHRSHAARNPDAVRQSAPKIVGRTTKRSINQQAGQRWVSGTE